MADPNSAFWGNAPADANDKSILIGISGSKSGRYAIPPKLPLAPGSPVSQSFPPVIGMSFALGIVILITGGRLATRALHRGQRFGFDDVMVIPAVLTVISYFAVNLTAFSHAGAGKHINYVTYSQFQLFHVIGVVSETLFFAAVNLIKISMLLFIRRVTGLSSRAWEIFNDVFLGILVAWFFISLFINIFPCSPVLTYYNYSSRAQHPEFKCLDPVKITIAFSVIHAVTDFILFCVPIYIILKVRMPLGRKIRLVLVFALGAVCVTASIVRTTLAEGGSDLDFTWTAVQSVCWTIVDITFSAAVVSLPALNAVCEDAFTLVTSSRFWTTLRGSESANGSSLGSSKEPASDVEKVNEAPSNSSTKQSGDGDREEKYIDFI